MGGGGLKSTDYYKTIAAVGSIPSISGDKRPMAPSSSLPTQLPILPLFDQAVLFPGLLLRLSVTAPSSTALLNHVLRSDQSTLNNLVLGCVPVRPGSEVAELVGQNGKERPALPAPETSKPSENTQQPARSATQTREFGCAARIKSISRLDRSYGTSGYVLVVEGTVHLTAYADSRNVPFPH
jgi:ATP-dependent protease La (LON) substrate-binding domain